MMSFVLTSQGSDLLFHIIGEHALHIESGEDGIDVHVVRIYDLLLPGRHDDTHRCPVQM